MRVTMSRRVACLSLLSMTMTRLARAQDDRPSDAQIVGILLVANQAEIASGRLALRKTQSRSVQSFAGRIISENGQVSDEANAMLVRLGVSAQRSGISDSIQRESRDELASLADTDEYSFDQAWLDHETDFLSRLVRSLDGYLRATSNPDLKTLLVRARPVFTFHLDQAHRLRIVLERPGFGR
jgi:putative membrane protein